MQSIPESTTSYKGAKMETERGICEGVYLLKRHMTMGDMVYFPWSAFVVRLSQCTRDMLVARPIGCRYKRHLQPDEFHHFFFAQRVIVSAFPSRAKWVTPGKTRVYHA